MSSIRFVLRIFLLRHVSWAACLALATGPLVAQAQEPNSQTPDRTPLLKEFQDNLQKILEVQLRAQTPQEFEFLALVVNRVEAKSLPLELVVGTFHWARRKPEHRVQFFMRALRIRAAEQGINDL